MRTLIGTLEAAGWQVRRSASPAAATGFEAWERRSLLRGADVVVLHQIKLSAIEAHLFASSAGGGSSTSMMPFTCASGRLGEAPDDSPWRKRKFAADLPPGGCGRRRQRCPGRPSRASPLRPSRFCPPRSIPPPITRRRPHRPIRHVVLDRSPENLSILEMIRPALARLTNRYPTLKMRVICFRFLGLVRGQHRNHCVELGDRGQDSPGRISA